jgi:hypothetical protein
MNVHIFGMFAQKKQLSGQRPSGTSYRRTCILYLAKRAANGTQLISVDAPRDFSKIPIVPSARHAQVIFCGQISPWAMPKAAKKIGDVPKSWCFRS